MSYWKEYYQQNKKKINKRIQEWRKNNSEKIKELNKKYRDNNIEKYRDKERVAYRRWISVGKNKEKKKFYQHQWYKQKRDFKQEENLEFKQLEEAIDRGQNLINGYIVELKQDREGKWFYYLIKFGALHFISDKFETKKQAIKDMQDAL